MDPSDAPRGRLGRLSARLQRLVFTPALLALCGILFLGSLPDEIRPAALDRASAASDRLLARLGTRAGCEVFGNTLGGDTKDRHLCVVVEGRLADGSTELLYESYPACRPPAVRAFEDYFDTSLKRVGDYRMARSLPRKSRREDALATLRRSRWLTREGRYFCDSEAVARSSALTDVYLIWQVDMTSYRTGRRRRSADVVHQVDCRRGRRALTAPPEVEVVRGVGPRVVLDG